MKTGPPLFEQEHQKPLSLRFDSQEFFPGLHRELGVSQTGAAIIADICAAGDWVSYSRTASRYDRPGRYSSPLYTWRKVVSQVDKLDALGLIEHDRRPPGMRGWQSAMKATPRLVEMFDSIRAGSPLPLARPPELIVLRDSNATPIDYSDSRQTCRMRETCAAINDQISRCNLAPEICAPVCRIFNENWNRGGRFYAVGASWQNMPKTERKSIRINGEETVELDFKNLHPVMLYSDVGATPPEDCYEIGNWPRPLVKVALLILLNAKTELAARQAIAQHAAMAAVAAPGSKAAHDAARRLVADVRARHAPIADKFGSDAGAGLMARDAAIMGAILADLARRGLSALPVHDSVIVQKSAAGAAESAMLAAADRAGIRGVRVVSA